MYNPQITRPYEARFITEPYHGHYVGYVLTDFFNTSQETVYSLINIRDIHRF
jgi:hypothetical protein